jgi:C1A family cysteine protease
MSFEGTYPRDLIKNLQKDGVCEKRLFETSIPWDTAIMHITDEIRENAKQYKIKTYLRLYSDSEMQTALMKLGALSVSIPITPKFIGDYNEMIDWEYVQKNRKGNHMVTIIGWEKKNGTNYWVCVNSWGNWGNYDGLFFLPFGYPINEAWSLTDEIVVHWAEKYWEYLNQNGVIIFEKDYDVQITRGQVFALLARYLGFQE